MKQIFAFGWKEGIVLLLGYFFKVISFNFSLQLKNTFIQYAISKVERHMKYTFISIDHDSEIGSYKAIIREESSDPRVFNQVMLEKEYKAVSDFIAQFVHNDSIKYIIDAGGNIGLTTLYFKKKFPNAHIVSVEPDERNMCVLKKNIILNRLKQITFVKGGLWGKEDKLKIDRSFRDGKDWSITLVSDSSNLASSSIKAYTISDIISNYHFPVVDILKIDIEGAERFVFEHDIHVAAFLKKVKFIAIEIHDEFNIREKILNQLNENGFSIFHNGELTIGANRHLISITNEQSVIL